MTIYGFHKLTSTLKSMEGISSDERYFEGLLTVQMKDKQGEVTIVDELYKVLPVWIDRGAPISDTHSNRIVGKGINYSRTTVKNGDGHELPAIKITGKIFKNYELDNVIWNKIKNNEYKGLSFGGATRSARSPIKMKDGTTAYALSDLEHYEVAVCADPAVPMAIITDFNQIAKANFNSSVRDDGKMVIQCDKMGCYVNKEKGDYCPNCGKGKKDLPDTTTMGGACPNCGHGFKPKPNTFTADDVKPIQKAGEMAGGGNGGGDLLTTMEGAKPENYKAVEEGKQRGRPIDKTEPTGLTEEQLKKWRAIQEDDKEDSDNQYYNKFMEKKEMLEATLDNKEEKRPTQSKRDMRENETSGYTPDLEKAIEIINKAGYRVDTEDRNNGTEINDTEREIPEKKLPIKGSLSQELPRGIQQANLNESQTFEQKVQALMAEGKSRESAEKIVGSFVHKVEASSGSGGAGIGGANLSNGGTITTQTGGANNPIHNSKCECDKCRSKGLDISNTGSFGVTEGAFNQNGANAQRLNNKSDDVDLDKIIEEETENIKGKKGGGGHRSLATRLTSGQNAKKKADDEEDEEVVEASEVEEEERPEWAWLMNHKSKATREVNKIHALMKLNKVKRQCRNCGLSATGLTNEGDAERKQTPEEKLDNDTKRNTKYDNNWKYGEPELKSTFKKPPEKEDKRWKKYMKLVEDIDSKIKSIGDDNQANPRSQKPSRDSPKKPHKHNSDRDDTNDPPTPKIRYSRGGDTAARQLKMSLVELIKKLPKNISDENEHNNPKWKSPDELPLDELDHTDVHGLAERGNSRLGNTDEVLGDSIVQNTSSHGDVQSNIGQKIRERGHGDKSGMQATMSRRNAEILRSNIEKALDELKKLTSKEHESHNSDSGGVLGEDDTVEEIKYPSRNIPKRIQGRHANEMQNYLNNPNQNYYSNMRYGKRGTKTSRKLEKALAELKKLQISGGLGSRGLGSEHGYTQGQQESTQVTLVQPRPEDDRVSSKRTTKEPKVVKKIRANRGVGAFGSDLPDGDKTPAVATPNTKYFDHNGRPHKTQAEADAVPARKRMNRRTSRDARNAYRADTRPTIGDRLKE